VQAGSVLMQAVCPRASGFLLAALEDFKTDNNEDGEDMRTSLFPFKKFNKKHFEGNAD
jgi:hypothetical protein